MNQRERSDANRELARGCLPFHCAPLSSGNNRDFNGRRRLEENIFHGIHPAAQLYVPVRQTAQKTFGAVVMFTRGSIRTKFNAVTSSNPTKPMRFDLKTDTGSRPLVIPSTIVRPRSKQN